MSTTLSLDLAGAAYQALARELKAHPALRGYVRTWRAWDGTVKADDPPVESQCPWVRLTPIALPHEYHSRRSISTPLRVEIETAVKKHDFPASAALWGRLMAAMFARDDRAAALLRAEVREAGAVEIVLENPAWPGSATDYGESLVTAKGSVLLRIFVRTR